MPSHDPSAALPVPIQTARRRQRQGYAALLMLALASLAAMYLLEFSWSRFASGIGQLGLLPSQMVPPETGGRFNEYLFSLAETLAIAFFGTFLAALLALPLALLGAANITRFWPFRFATRRSLDVIRAVDQLIWAIIFVSVVGLGPFAGVLAVMVSDAGTLGKIFSDAIENIDRKPVDGLKATGAAPPLVLRFAVLPQVAPVILGQTLYFLESNCRTAGVLGIVGAGGIGVHLYDSIRLGLWPQVTTLLLMILALVILVDMFSGFVRKRLL